MKTIDNLRKYFLVVTISILLLASTLEAGAQNSHNQGKKGNDRDRKEYRQPDRNNDRTANYDRRDRNDGNRDNRNYESRDNRNGNHQKYSKNNNYAQPNYYNHSRYGRVYNRFDRNPIVFRHSRGDYYYSDNNFYRYNNGIGYCMVEPPRNVYFRDLPFDCERVNINGSIFFRNSDLFFQHSRRGYAIVPSPIQVHISARF